MTRPVLTVAAITLAATALAALLLGPAWTAPGLFGDDLKWQAGAHTYVPNLEREARWGVWWWNTGLGLADEVWAFRLCLMLWVATCAVAAEAWARRPVAAALMGLALFANPGMLSLTMWPLSSLSAFAGLFAGVLALRVVPVRPLPLALAALAACAALALLHQLLLIHAVGIGLVMLAARAERPWAAAAGLLAGAAAGTALGTLLGFGVNWWTFGFFGVLEDPWRHQILGLGPGPRAAVAAAAYTWRELAAALQGWLPALCAAAALAALGGRSVVGALAAVCAVLGTVALPLVTGIPLSELRGASNMWLGLCALAALPMRAERHRFALPLSLAVLLLLTVVALPRATAELAQFAREEAHTARVVADAVAFVRERAPEAREVVLHGRPEGVFEGRAARPEWAVWWVYFMIERDARRAYGRLLPVEYCIETCRLRTLPEDRAASTDIFPHPAALAVREGVAWLRIGP